MVNEQITKKLIKIYVNNLIKNVKVKAPIVIFSNQHHLPKYR